MHPRRNIGRREWRIAGYDLIAGRQRSSDIQLHQLPKLGCEVTMHERVRWNALVHEHGGCQRTAEVGHGRADCPEPERAETGGGQIRIQRREQWQLTWIEVLPVHR